MMDSDLISILLALSFSRQLFFCVYVHNDNCYTARERTMIKRHRRSLACQCLINTSSFVENNKIRVDHKVSSVSLDKIPSTQKPSRSKIAELKKYLRRFFNYRNDI